MSESVKTAKGARTRQRIILSARQLLADTDLNSLTLDEVAARSAIAKSSVLWHFGSKNGLLLAVVNDIFAEMEQALAAISKQKLTPKRYLETLVALFAESMHRNPEANALMIAFMVNRTFDEQILREIRLMYQRFRQTVRQLLTNAGVKNGHALAVPVLALIDGIYLQWYLAPEEVDLKQNLLAAIDALTLEF